MKKKTEREGYIVEFLVVGKAVKATAIDPVSMREVSVVGGTRNSKKELSNLAVRKLEYVMNRDKDSDGTL